MTQDKACGDGGMPLHGTGAVRTSTGKEAALAACASERSPRRRPGAIDWETHFSAVIDCLQEMHRCVEGSVSDPERHSRMLAWMMRGIALRLRSRHIPPAARARFPEIPWHGIAAWLAREDALEGTGMLHPEGGAGLLDFTRAAPALVAPLRRLQEELEMMDADGNQRDGVLAWEQRAAFAHVTLRLPADRVGTVLAALEQAYEGIEAPTREGVRATLATIGDKLAAQGIRRLRVIGSVAQGVATPASDIDLLYEAAPTGNAWRLWCDLLALLEGALGRVVDLHEFARLPARSRAGAVTVWRRRGSGPKRGATT